MGFFFTHAAGFNEGPFGSVHQADLFHLFLQGHGLFLHAPQSLPDAAHGIQKLLEDGPFHGSSGDQDPVDGHGGPDLVIHVASNQQESHALTVYTDIHSKLPAELVRQRRVDDDEIVISVGQDTPGSGRGVCHCDRLKPFRREVGHERGIYFFGCRYQQYTVDWPCPCHVSFLPLRLPGRLQSCAAIRCRASGLKGFDCLLSDSLFRSCICSVLFFPGMPSESLPAGTS